MNQPQPKNFTEVITPDMKLCSLLETYWHSGGTIFWRCRQGVPLKFW